jgi:hypothetical protein
MNTMPIKYYDGKSDTWAEITDLEIIKTLWKIIKLRGHKRLYYIYTTYEYKIPFSWIHVGAYWRAKSFRLYVMYKMSIIEK